MRCLVLGGRGFIGSHLIDALLSGGHFVRSFDRPNVAGLGTAHIVNPNFEFHEGDLVTGLNIEKALAGCDICFHLISTTIPKSSNANPVFDVESNLLGTIRLLNHAVSAGLKKIVFISSGGTVYGIPQEIPIPETHPTDPICSYGITKLAIEKYLALFRELHGLDYTVLRLANPFGGRQRTQASQGAIAVFLGRALREEPVQIWGDGSLVRDYIFIDDVISALLRVMQATTPERVFNIGSGIGTSLNEVLDTIESIIGKKIIRSYMQGRLFDVPVNVLRIDQARRELGWAPSIPFAEGVRRFAVWILNQGQV